MPDWARKGRSNALKTEHNLTLTDPAFGNYALAKGRCCVTRIINGLGDRRSISRSGEADAYLFIGQINMNGADTVYGFGGFLDFGDAGTTAHAVNREKDSG